MNSVMLRDKYFVVMGGVLPRMPEWYDQGMWFLMHDRLYAVAYVVPALASTTTGLVDSVCQTLAVQAVLRVTAPGDS